MDKEVDIQLLTSEENSVSHSAARLARPYAASIRGRGLVNVEEILEMEHDLTGEDLRENLDLTEHWETMYCSK